MATSRGTRRYGVALALAQQPCAIGTKVLLPAAQHLLAAEYLRSPNDSDAVEVVRPSKS